jgi:small subunit ribosomal protein S17e
MGDMMGKVRTEMVKRISLELLDKYPKSFSLVFEENKQFLKEINLDVSKKLRNKIAGYVTRLVNIDQAIFEPQESETQPLS